MNIIEEAREFASKAHAIHRRKYTQLPYFVHLDEVAQLLIKRDCFADEVIAAAYLHDVIEDNYITGVDYKQVVKVFGEVVANIVLEVTDATSWAPDLKGRALRKRIDRQYLAGASPAAQSIKLADLISNTKDIVANDLNFAKIYIPEKAALLQVLWRGDHVLRHDARNCVQYAKMKIQEAASAA